MGILCCKKANKTRQLKEIAPEEQEIRFSSYSSKFDSILEPVDKKFNYWSDIQLGEFLPNLIKFSLSNATLAVEDLPLPKKINSKENFYKEEFSVDIFQSFIENKILKSQGLYQKAGNDEIGTSTFKEITLEMFKSLQLKLDQHFGAKDPGRMKKKHAIVFGLLYCQSSNISRIKCLFDLFSNDQNMFCPSPDLDEFMLSMFLTASYCTLAARKKAANVNSKIIALSSSDIKDMINCMELKDSQNLIKVFNEKFFSGKNGLTYGEVKNNFSSNGFGWIFNSKGIRSLLEVNNV